MTCEEKRTFSVGMAAGVLQVRLAGLIATSREWVIEEDTDAFYFLGWVAMIWSLILS